MPVLMQTSLGGGQKPRGTQAEEQIVAPTRANIAHVGSAARLALRNGRIGVGFEEQLHHIERRALGSSVVQG